MKEKNDEPVLRKPPGPFVTALEYGVFGAAIGAAFGAVLGKISGRPGQSVVPRAIEGAADTALFSGLLGYFMGERDMTEHHLKVENLQLQRALVEEKKKTFLQTITDISASKAHDTRERT